MARDGDADAGLGYASETLLALEVSKRRGIITGLGRELLTALRPAQRSCHAARDFRALLDDTADIKESPRVITLAAATPADAAAIAALCAELDEFYGDIPEGSPDQRTAQVRDALFGDPPGGWALLAWDSNAILAGCASYLLLWPASGLSTSLYLKELYVGESYRRAGVGKLLMDGLYAIAAERRCSRVEWTTGTSNQVAQAFHESMGVKPLASKIFYRAADTT